MSGERLALDPAREVGIYACGPTVYSRIHIGNARPFVIFSLLTRFLKSEGYQARLAINVTDINDKIYTAAAERGVASSELAAEMTAAYFEDTGRLGLGRPDAEPLATATIGPIVELIGDLVEGGHAYESGGDVYFSVRSFDGYGKLSHRPTEDMEQGEDDSGSLKRDRLDLHCGRRARTGRTPSGSRRGARAVPAGTSSARRWPRPSSASFRSRSTAAGPTWFSRTTRTRSPSPRPRAVDRWPGSGCTTA